MENKPKAVISLFDLSGEAVKPWFEDGYQCFCFDAQHPEGINLHPEIEPKTYPKSWFYGNVHIANSVYTVGGQAISPMGEMDERSWTSIIELLFKLYDVQMVMGWPPCTDLATSGARHFQAKGEANPRFQKEAMELVYFVRDIGISYKCPWFFENPVSMISSYYKRPDYTFSPHEYGLYLPEDDVSPDADGIIPPRDQYTKKTCIWSGNGFVMPEKKPVELPDGYTYSPQYKRLGGRSQKTKNIRSKTPRGFARAVWMANRSWE